MLTLCCSLVRIQHQKIERKKKQEPWSVAWYRIIVATLKVAKEGENILGKALELGASKRLLVFGAVGKATSSGLAADLDLASLVQSADKAKDDAGQPESAGKLAVLLDVLELVGTGSINLLKVWSVVRTEIRTAQRHRSLQDPRSRGKDARKGRNLQR